MEDNQTLLMMVLKQHFRDRPQILDEALRIIKEYSNQDSTSEQYEKVKRIFTILKTHHVTYIYLIHL